MNAQKGVQGFISIPAEERFWAKVEKTETCWLWTAYQDGGGYGQFRVNGHGILAHRFAYELLIGPIPAGLTLDHLCRVRHCVNPAHLEPVSQRENTLRGESFAAQEARRTHCHKGHAYDLLNTRIYRGWRRCRACAALHQREVRYVSNRITHQAGDKHPWEAADPRETA